MKSQTSLKKKICELVNKKVGKDVLHWKSIQSLRVHTGNVRVFYSINNQVKYVDLPSSLQYLSEDRIYDAVLEISNEFISNINFNAITN